VNKVNNLIAYAYRIVRGLGLGISISQPDLPLRAVWQQMVGCDFILVKDESRQKATANYKCAMLEMTKTAALLGSVSFVL
jgi:hypothetical protein